MRAKLGLTNPMILLALLGLMVFAGSCRNNEVEVPPLTGPSGHRLFINVQANPDHLVIHAPGRPRETSEITLQLKNQQGAGVPGEGIKLRILNGSGFEVNIGRLSDYNVTTDANGFARVIYTAPDSAEQVVATTIIIRAVLTNAAYPDEVVDNHPLELQASSVDPGDCAGGLAPETAFTINPTNPNAGDTVCFDATGTFPSAIEFFWDFGDGGQATGPVVCHQFDDFGTFTVSVLGRDGDRNCGQQTQAVVVAQGAAPSCTILVSPTPVLVDQLTNFTGIGTDTDNDRIRRFQWIFGDGGTASSSRNTVTHRYRAPGSFSVVLTVTDDTGLTGTCQTSVAVTDDIAGNPVCSFTVSPNNIQPGTPVSVNASASTDDGTIVNYNVDFGDGTAPVDSASPIINKAGGYAAAGSYTITLTVTDDDGNDSVCTGQITVGAALPQCSDGVDNDFDTFIDLLDPECSAANDNDESA